MKYLLFIAMVISALTSCQKEEITMGEHVSETFYVDNNHASMRVLVEGNTQSRNFLIFVHGGPGSSSFFYNTDYISQNIEDKYACVYWDQRNAGASQGNANGNTLNVTQMTNDLKKLILILRNRYGENSRIFILGHSFGGLLTSSFMTTDNNQHLVNGWILLDGSHNYPLNDSLSRKMLISAGQQQIGLNLNKEKWTEIINYCNAHRGNFTLEESNQLIKYASDAESYFDEVTKINMTSIGEKYALKYNWPIYAILINQYNSLHAPFNNDLAKTEFTSKLKKVTIPILLIYGKYDFVCPKEVGEDILNHVSSEYKKMVISPVSGHYVFCQDESLFCREVNDFIKNQN